MASAVTTATGIARDIATGRTGSRDVVEAHLALIDALNPALNAIVTLDAAGARAQADAADLAVAEGRSLGPLHGVPITIKDTFATAGMRTTAGSPRLAGHVPTRDATAVARLRAAGAIVIGKTNTPPFATGAETTNALFGRTVNPWDPGRTAGGSSGGSAAAVAAGLSPLDLGSDIGGSIRTPSHFCGAHGLKPTDSLVSPIGHVPPPPGAPWGLVRTLLSVGPIARSIDDLELALEVIAGSDPERPDVPPVALARSPAPAADQLRIAWWDDFGVPLGDETQRVLRGVVDRLAAAGVAVEHVAPDGFDAISLAATASEIQACAAGSRGTPLHLPRPAYRAAARLVARSDPAAAGFLRGMGGNLGTLARAMSARDRAIERLEGFLAGRDAWLVPAAPCPAFPHLRRSGTLDQLRARLDIDGTPVPLVVALEAFASPFNLTGSPVVVLPSGRDAGGLPVGLQLVGRRWGDMGLLATARAVREAALPDIGQPPTSREGAT